VRIAGGRTRHIRSWTGPLIEDAEPDQLEVSGALDDGQNLMARAGGLREVRGGSAAVLTFAAVAGNPITDVLGVFPYSAPGLAVCAHAAAGSKHYAYGLDDTPAFITGTEATSRVDMGWNTATPARPLGVELFEKLYVVDASPAANRNGMVVLSYSGGSWTITTPTYDLDTSGGAAQVLRAYSAEVFNGVLFVSGYDSETSNNAPHLVRHSLLGTDPSGSGGFDPRAYAILGAKGQYVRAMRAGRSVMLVAKDAELYAISGAGRGLPGWQYQIQQVLNTVGAGCTNPYALDHAMGYWYGLGDGGPWRSDGAQVESLLPPRRRSWRQLDGLERAVVRYHPERRQVWFYMPQPSLSGYVAAPNIAWVWDTEREQWDLNHRTNRSYHYLHAVAQAPDLPAAAPSDVAQSWSYGEEWSEGILAMWGTFTQGDAFAETEVWQEVPGMGYSLSETLPAGVKRFRVAGSGNEPYQLNVKLRHKKGVSLTDFSAEASFYGAIRAPLYQPYWRGTSSTHYPGYGGGSSTSYPVRSQVYIQGVSLDGYAEQTADPARFSHPWVGQTNALITVDDTYYASFSNAEFSAANERSDWPVGHQSSPLAVANVTALVVPSPPAPRQSLFGNFLAATQIDVVWAATTNDGDTYHLEYRVLGSGGAFTAAASYVAAGSTGTLSPQLTSITGLTGGTRYEVRTRKATGGAASSTTMHTALLPPTSITATTNGSSGSPSVPLAIVVPQSGHGLRVYNAAQTYDNLTASASAGTTNLTSTVGVGGTGDRYFARTYDSNWPTGFQYSTAVSDDITDPETTGS
jgi:hypothetical protein